MTVRHHGEVAAAGGVVWRRGADDIEVLLVHRPRYDDWSLPKGKLDPGETFVDGAVREVREETGFIVVLGDELEPSHYRDRYGRPKIVRYWSMTVVDGAFEPNDEVDEMAWLPLDAVAAHLTYARDADVLASFVRTIDARGPA